MNHATAILEFVGAFAAGFGLARMMSMRSATDMPSLVALSVGLAVLVLRYAIGA